MIEEYREGVAKFYAKEKNTEKINRYITRVIVFFSLRFRIVAVSVDTFFLVFSGTILRDFQETRKQGKSDQLQVLLS